MLMQHLRGGSYYNPSRSGSRLDNTIAADDFEAISLLVIRGVL